MFSIKNITKRVALIAAFAFLIFTNANYAQTLSAPEKAANDFYKWYLHELNKDKFPVDDAKPQLLKMISKRLGKWVYSKTYREYGADYFIDAQDWDKNWESGIKISKAAVKGNTATLKVTLISPGEDFGNHTLNVKLVKETGKWKIDRIKGENN